MELGPEGQQQQRRRGRDRVEERLEELLAARVEPVQILEEDHRGGPTAARPHEALKHGDDRWVDLAAALARRGITGLRHPEKAKQAGQRLGQLGLEQHHGSRDLAARALRILALAQVEGVVQVVDQRQEGDAPAVGHGVADGGGDPARATALDELETQAALSDPRLAHDPHHGGLAVAGALERGLERRHLVHAAHELREPAGARELEAGAHGARAPELVDAHGSGDPLHRCLAQIA